MKQITSFIISQTNIASCSTAGKTSNIIKYILPVLLLFLYTGCSVTYKSISNKNFYWYYKTRKVRTVLIDLRPAEKFKKGHMPGAVNIELTDKNFKKKIKHSVGKNAKDVWIIFAYSHDKRSTEEMLKKFQKLFKYHAPFKGPAGIFYLKDGFIHWKGTGR